MLLHLPHSGRAQRPAAGVRSGLWASGRLGLEPKPLVGASALAFEGKLAIGAIEVGLRPGGWSCLRARGCVNGLVRDREPRLADGHLERVSGGLD